MNLHAGATEFNRFVLLLPIAFELMYFGFSFTAMPPLFIAFIAFPAMFIFPGTMLLAVLRKKIWANAVQLVVEGFLISTIIVVMLTSILIAMDLSLTSFAYSVVTLSFVSILTIIGFAKKTEIRPSNHDILLLGLAFIVYVVLMPCLSSIPRLFTPDETSYVFSARMGFLNGIVPPMVVGPNSSGVTALLNGRSFWIYLLTSFLGSTGLPAYQAGLIGVGFLIMTALASSLIVKSKRLGVIVFAAVAINPLLFSFSILTLNDLAISFYAVFAVLFFVRSFSRTGDIVSLNVMNLSYSLIGVIVLTLIKPNLLVFLAMWIILVCVMLKYKLYRLNRRYNILLMAALLPVLLYELCIDLPYVISVWVFRNGAFGDLFHKFLFISPIERFVGWFITPWWNPAAPTLLTHSFVDLIDYFYRILSPEHSSLLVSAFILALPILIMFRDMHKELDKTILTSLVLLSLCLFYFDAVSSLSLSDASRYSLWMMPLWIPIALMVLKDIFDSSSFRKLFPVLIAALIFLWMNIWLSEIEGGVYVGYYLRSRVWTADAIMIQLVSMMILVGMLFLSEDLPKIGLVISRKLSVLKTVHMKNAVFCLLIILMLLSGVYFSSQFMVKSQLYENPGLITVSDAINNLTDTGSLVFANSYIYTRPYVSDEIFKNGLVLPPPETEEGFLNLLEVAPNKTMFLISNNRETAWYEYANSYIKNFTNADFITPDKPDMVSLSKFNLSDDILHMTFDDANNITVPDSSPSKNNGINIGAQVVEGYSDKALDFNGTGYVTIPNEGMPSFQSVITIDFMALVKQADPQQGYMIISKGYAAINGSFDVFIWNKEIYFELGSIGYIDFPVQNYLGEWHNFVFTYNGEEMEALVDGISVASQPASGFIRASTYDVEIGRDGERQTDYFNGTIDELQISDSPLNTTALAEDSLKHYALKIQTLSGSNWVNTFFKTVNRGNSATEANVHVNSTRITINNNLTITLSMTITSDIPVNATVLTSTNRFTEVYPINLTKGPNNVNFEYPYNISSSSENPGGSYWLYLDQAEVTLIINNKIIFNGFVSIQTLPLMNLYLLLLAGVLLTTYLMISYANSRHRKSLLERLDAQYLSTSTRLSIEPA